LDGTLLDQDTYEFQEARPLLESLKAKSMPVIICTSKTRAEIEECRRRMGLREPFIAENGAAVFVPRDLIKVKRRGVFLEKGIYDVAELGFPHEELRQTWDQVKAREHFRMKGFSEMTIEEISDLTGLSYEDARLAAMREYSEPFVFHESPDRLRRFEALVQERGLQVTRGGRFHHLIGQNDKGKAVGILKQVYGDVYPNARLWTVGLGDSTNDIPMLMEVDIPVVIRKKNGSWQHLPAFGPVIYSSKAGPAGWAETLHGVLS
jgi:mannosyl-3-phosphoglycerate phosphatase